MEKSNRLNDNFVRWIEFSQLKDVTETTSYNYQCVYTAVWLEPKVNDDVSINVMLKKVADGCNAELFDFYEVKSFLYRLKCCCCCVCWCNHFTNFRNYC